MVIFLSCHHIGWYHIRYHLSYWYPRCIRRLCDIWNLGFFTLLILYVIFLLECWNNFFFPRTSFIWFAVGFWVIFCFLGNEHACCLWVSLTDSFPHPSSFLKQHNDDKAAFQSFKDINGLIKDMLELKKRNAAVETELKEMQGRYSQLSLKFAEVEGERQQLVMSLKSRSPRKS